MSNIVLFDPKQQQQNLPAYLQTGSVNVNAGLLATIGEGGNRIGLKGNRFRLVVNGKEEKVFDENYLDVIVVGVVPAISRAFYKDAYKEGEKARPTCYSADGKAPPADLESKQHATCEGCPQNEKGSRVVDGVKMKACGFFQRLIIMLPGDDSGNFYKVDVKSQGLFGDGQPQINKYNLREYGKMLRNRGADVAKLVTRLTFDTNSSTPKLLFQPFAYVTEEDYVRVVEAVQSDEVKNLLKINMQTIDLSNEVADDNAVAATPAAPAEPAVQAAPVTPAQAAAVQQAPTPTPAPAPAQEAPKPQQRQYRMNKEVAGEWTYNQLVAEGWTLEQLLANNYMIDVTPEPEPVKPPAPPAPPAPPKPPGPPKPPAQQAAATPVAAAIPVPPKAAAAAPAPANVPRPQEVSSDQELDALIGSLAL